MDTLVADPFYEAMPRYFQLSFAELLAAKHPTAWVEFERGDITEAELFAKFFADGRRFDGPGLVDHMVTHYEASGWVGCLNGGLCAIAWKDELAHRPHATLVRSG